MRIIERACNLRQNVFHFTSKCSLFWYSVFRFAFTFFASSFYTKLNCRLSFCKCFYFFFRSASFSLCCSFVDVAVVAFFLLLFRISVKLKTSSRCNKNQFNLFISFVYMHAVFSFVWTAHFNINMMNATSQSLIFGASRYVC